MTVRPARRSKRAPVARLIPATLRDIAQIASECRKLVTRRALISAGASVVPLPGIDVAVDITVLIRMLEEINQRFGLTPQQIEQLAPQRRLFAYKAAMAVGSAFIGRIVTRELVIKLLKTVGVRLSVKQAAKYVPFAGQAVAASLSFAALKALGDRHIKDCVRVAETLIDPRDDNVVATF
ncbi:MAG TPA: hypothetical protein VES91_03110 [Burkholderiaceae bacterium]|nr:hypothetical protein [Burkholderiaceae bacterium]